MSELSKNQLTTENNNSFPNNNTGFITPTLLRTFNQNMIDSLVDEQQYNVDSGSFNARINALDPSGSAQALIALEQATASLNAYTQSQNSFNSSATASIVALQNFSSSLDTTYATDAQLSASASTLQNNINTKLDSASFNAYTASVSTAGFVTTSSFNTYTQSAASGVSASINSATQSLSSSVAAINASQLSTASFNTYTASAATNTSASINAATSSLSSSISSSIGDLSASVAAINATQLSTASFNTYTASAATNVSGAINVATQSLSSSVATTTSNLSSSIGSLSASVAVTTGTQLSTSSFNVYTQSANLSFSQLRNSVSQSATTGSNTFIGNQIVSGNVNIAGNITAESASFLYLKTIFETASIIFSSGSNQFGDELSDVQTLSGSVRVEGGLTVNGVAVTASFDASGYLLTSSFNTYTQSAGSAVSASINSATQSLSSSIATTTSGLSSSIGNLSSSVAVTTNNLSSSIATTTNNLDLEVNQKLDSSSFNTYTQSNDTKVNALIAATGSYAISSSVAAAFDAFSSSISLTYATETELSASASTLQNGINSKVENSTFNTYTQSQSNINAGLTAAIQTRLTTASFNSYTSSNDSKVNSLIAATGSYITSAQTSSMSVLSSSYAVTASFALNAGASVDTGSLLTTASFNAYTQSASTNVSESINSATQSLSSSIATTTNNLDLEVNGKLDSSSFNTYTQSNDSKVNSLISATGSYITSAQTSSMSVLSSSYSVTASFALNVTPTDVSMFVSQSTFNAYTQSNDGKVNSLISATGSYVTESETGSFATTGSNTFKNNQIISGNLDVTGKITALSASITYLETIYQTSSVVYSSGSNIFGDEASDTQTLFGKVDIKTGPLVITGSTFASGNIRITENSKLIAHDIEAGDYQGIEINNNGGNAVALFGAGGSLGTTFYGQINATAISASGNITGNLIGTASFATKALTASFAENVSPTDVSMFVSQSTFNSYTSSNDGKVNSLIAATGSYITNSGSFATTGSNTFIGNQIISGNLLVSGANINLEVDAPALSVGVTNVKTFLDTTASGVVTSTDIYRTGAGPTGDLSGIRLQTLSGSDTTGDTLLSRITTGVNRHTSTAMTGSVVNTILQSTWATGSGGTRVSYASNVILNAQSASSTLTLNAGAGATFAGGTASLAAGLVRIGATNGTISSTGSFGPMVIVGSVANPAISVRSGSVEITTPQGSGSFYSNVPITSSGLLLNGLARFSGVDIIGLGGAAGSGSLFVQNAITASVISASQYIGIGLVTSASYAINAGNALSASFATNATTAETASYVLNAVSASNATLAVTASFANQALSSSFATEALTASFALNVQNINTSSLATTGSNTFRDTQYIISGAISGTFVDNAGSIYTQSNAVRHIVNLGSASYASIAVPDANTLYVITGDEQYVLNSQTASFATTGSNRFNGNQIITGSLTLSSSAAVELNVIGNTILTGSVQGNIVPITIASTTASIDCNLGNFFTLTLANGTNHISASNIRPGQTINLRVTTVSGNAVTCSSVIKQTSGSAYVPTNGSGTDILTLVSFDNTTLFMANVKNLV